MVHTTLTENPKKKPTIFTYIQTTLSSSKKIFQESAIFYEKYLKNSGYKTKLQYQQPKENNQNKNKRKRLLKRRTLFGSIHHTASPWKPISG